MFWSGERIAFCRLSVPRGSVYCRLLGFLVCMCWIVCAAGKPVIDMRDGQMMPPGCSQYERSCFILNYLGQATSNANCLLFDVKEAAENKRSYVIVLTDRWLAAASLCRQLGYKRVVAYILEPRAIHPAVYTYVENHINDFDRVLTCDAYLLNRHPSKARFIHAMGLGDLESEGVHPKSKLCAMMPLSAKLCTEGHVMRRNAFELFKPYYDGYKEAGSPWTRWRDPWLNDFCFCVSVENSREAHYFTEKLIQPLRAGTIPIYWGCPTISLFFDMDGIIVFNSLEELGEILKNLSFEEYQRRLPAVRRNFELAAQYAQCYFPDHPERADVIDSLWSCLADYLMEERFCSSSISRPELSMLENPETTDFQYERIGGVMAFYAYANVQLEE